MSSHSQRKYVRENPECTATKNFHGQFKSWLNTAFPNGVDEETWEALIEEDKNHPYGDYPINYPPQQPGFTENEETLMPQYDGELQDHVNPQTYEFSHDNSPENSDSLLGD